jgi:HPt (histidine-containing phosphotransfer) domain-containing protein
VTTFLEEAPTLLATLRSANEARDAERFRRAAHSLKSNGNTFGALAFGAMARELELGGLQSDASKNAQALDALDAAYARAAAALTELGGG